MANFRLTELTDAESIQTSDAIYLVQNNLSKKITFQNLFNSIPSTNIFGNLNVTDGEILSGSSPIQNSLEDTFQLKDRKTLVEYPIRNFKDNRGPSEFPLAGGSPLSAFSNAIIFLSGDATQGDDTTGYDSRAIFKIESYDLAQLPVGFNVKVVQMGTLKITLSAGSGVNINDRGTNGGSTNMNTLCTRGQFASFDLYKLPDTALSAGRFALINDTKFN